MGWGKIYTINLTTFNVAQVRNLHFLGSERKPAPRIRTAKRCRHCRTSPLQRAEKSAEPIATSPSSVNKEFKGSVDEGGEN